VKPSTKEEFLIVEKKIKDIEILLGNVTVESEHYVKNLQEKVHSEFYEKHQKELEDLCEAFFVNICEDLHSLGLSSEQTATTINHLFQEDSKMAAKIDYCNATEVDEALKDKKT
jgi:hypothetical protein